MKQRNLLLLLLVVVAAPKIKNFYCKQAASQHFMPCSQKEFFCFNEAA